MRSKEEIETDIKELCRQAGHLQYAAKEAEAMLAEINERLFNLKKELLGKEEKTPISIVTNQTFKEVPNGAS